MLKTFKVSRIHCDGCARTVTKAVTAVPGVEKVDVRLDTKEVTVNFDPARAPEEAIKAALAKVGYPSDN